jgi:hypothetical protein
MMFLSIYLGSLAAARRRFCIRLFRAFSVQVATTAPQTSRGVLAVGPDIAKVLAVVALHKANLSSVKLCINNNMVKAVQPKYLLLR